MGRWSDYFHDEHFSDFWRQRMADPKVRVLVVFGLGFDPRSLASLQVLAALGLPDRVGYLALKIVARPAFGSSASVVQKLSVDNEDGLKRTAGCRSVGTLDVETQDSEGHSIAGRRTLEAMAKARNVLSGYSDVVVDISGMPRGMFFPLIAYLMRSQTNECFRICTLAS